jgi:hypothetical protein
VKVMTGGWKQIPYEKLQSFVSFVDSAGNQVPSRVGCGGYPIAGRRRNLPRAALSALDR